MAIATRRATPIPRWATCCASPSATTKPGSVSHSSGSTSSSGQEWSACEPASIWLSGNLAKPSPRHARTGRTIARHAFEIAQQAGDLTYAAISCNNLLTQLLASGAPLAEVQREAEAGLDFARRARFDLVGGLITAQLRLIRTLRGLTPVFGCFNDDGFAEQQFERRLEDEPSSWDNRLDVLDTQAASAHPC